MQYRFSISSQRKMGASESYNREEKSLRRVALAAKFLDDNKKIKKTSDIDELAPGPAIRSYDSAQRMD